jgi:holin-like protein
MQFTHFKLVRDMGAVVRLAALLLLFQAIGKGLVLRLELSISSSIAGMILLFLYLCVRNELPQQIHAVAGTSMRHMSLLFIPAGAGLMAHTEALRADWQAIVLSVVGGTICTLVVTAFSFRIFHFLRELFLARAAEE